MLYRTGGSPIGPAIAFELCRHAWLNIEPNPLYGVLRTLSGGFNCHTWSDQDRYYPCYLNVGYRSTIWKTWPGRSPMPNAWNSRFWFYLTLFGRDAYTSHEVFCGAGCKQRAGVQRIDLRRWSNWNRPTRAGVWDRGWILWRIGLFCLQLHT